MSNHDIVLGKEEVNIDSLAVGDVEIGAVELKNGTDDTRATVKSDGTDNALVVTQNNQQAKITDGTNTANVIAGDSGQNALVQTGASRVFTGSVTATGDIVNQDARNYKWTHLQITGTFVATYIFEVSDDNATWVAAPLQPLNSSAATFGAAVGIYHGPIQGRYFRVRCSAYTSGTVNATVVFYASPGALTPLVGQGDAVAGSVAPNTGVHVYNGTTWDRLRAAGGTTGTTGTGLLGVAPQLVGVTNFSNQRAAIAVSADADAGIGLPIAANLLFNGTNWDRWRGNESVSLLASGSRTTTQTSADLVNYNGASFLDVILDVTSAGTGSVTLSINAKDVASAKYYLLLTGAAVTTNSTNVYRVGVGLTAAANSIANLPVPRSFQIVVTANNANAVTYSVGYNLARG